MNVQRPILPPLHLPEPAAPRPAAHAGGTTAAAAPAPATAQDSATLWDVLTPEEREFFQQLHTLGALNYAPGKPASTPANAPLGQRIDVRG
jgi:hypothetical protein